MFGFSALSGTLNRRHQEDSELKRRLANVQAELQRSWWLLEHAHRVLCRERIAHDELKKKYESLLEDTKPKCGCRTCCTCCCKRR